MEPSRHLDSISEQMKIQGWSKKSGDRSEECPMGQRERTSTTFRECIRRKSNIENSSGATAHREKAETSHREGGNGAETGTSVVLTRLRGFFREKPGSQKSSELALGPFFLLKVGTTLAKHRMYYICRLVRPFSSIWPLRESDLSLSQMDQRPISEII